MITIGNTPLIKVDKIFAKLECTNPCGSIKDRIAKYIIDKSEKKGILRKGMTIVEATSGNTGIALSYYGREKGYKVTIVMPENMTEERKQIIKDFSAELILCSKKGSFAEAAAIRDKIAQSPGYFNPDQFSNPLNVECHYKTTGQEILKQMKKHSKKIDAFVAGVGTGGTLMGVGKALKEVFPDMKLVAVEPTESAVMSGGKHGEHKIAGIGDGFIPAIVKDEDDNNLNNLNSNKNNERISKLIDEVICISSKDAINAAKYLSTQYGYCVGVSSGANFLAAKKLFNWDLSLQNNPKIFFAGQITGVEGYTESSSMGLYAA